MSERMFISSINFSDFELLFENVSFPLTKAEVICKAKKEGFPAGLLNLLNNLPSRFYRSKNELFNQCLWKSMRAGQIFYKADCLHTRL
jgi:hypothetical protein